MTPQHWKINRTISPAHLTSTLICILARVLVKSTLRSKWKRASVWVRQQGLIYARLKAPHAKGRDVSRNGVTGVADKGALVSAIKLMDDRTSPTYRTFTPTLFPFVDFRSIGCHPRVKRIIRPLCHGIDASAFQSRPSVWTGIGTMTRWWNQFNVSSLLKFSEWSEGMGP